MRKLMKTIGAAAVLTATSMPTAALAQAVEVCTTVKYCATAFGVTLCVSVEKCMPVPNNIGE